MTDDGERGGDDKGFNGTKVEVPAWVMAVTYILSWALGFTLIAVQLIGQITYRPLLIALSIYLIFWPMFQVSPAEIIKRVFPG